MGRPSKYQSEYCEQLVAHMSQGLSFESFAGSVGVHRDTLYQWAKDYPEFSDAKKEGWAASLLFYEQIGLQGMQGQLNKFNATSWIFTMKCRFRQSGWDENAKAVQDTPTLEDDKIYTDEELMARIRKLTGA